MHTSGYMVSLGFNRADVAKHLWFYIYDEDIPPSRVYSPSLKSPDNAPKTAALFRLKYSLPTIQIFPPPKKY